MAIKRDSELSSIIDHIHYLSKICNSNIQTIGATCPTHISTRWIYDYDIIEFIIKHKFEIEKHEKIDENIYNLEKSLRILKALIKIFEDPNTPLGSAYIIIKHAIYALEELAETTPYANIIKKYLSLYTLESEECNELLMTSYILTPKGHDYFYNKLLDPHMQETRRGFINDFYVKNGPNIDEIDEALTNLTEEGVNTILGTIEDEEYNYEYENNEIIHQNDDDVIPSTDPDLNVRVAFDYRKGLLQQVFDFIRKWAEQFIIDRQKLLQFYNIFHEYTVNSLENLPKIRDKYYDSHLTMKKSITSLAKKTIAGQVIVFIYKKSITSLAKKTLTGQFKKSLPRYMTIKIFDWPAS